MPEKEQWHLDKRLNVGHLLTTISVAGLLVIWAMNMESRIAEHEVRITTNTKQLEKSEERTNQTFERVYNLVSKINDKLDRLIERQ